MYEADWPFVYKNVSCLIFLVGHLKTKYVRHRSGACMHTCIQVMYNYNYLELVVTNPEMVVLLLRPKEKREKKKKKKCFTVLHVHVRRSSLCTYSRPLRAVLLGGIN